MENKKCLLCGNSTFSVIHHGTRDNANINVKKCDVCGLVTLSEFLEDTNEMYQNGGMHKNGYDAISDTYHDIQWSRWVEMTSDDDDRRYEALKEVCREKNVLEFGCGNGGFLRRIKDVAKRVAGIELDEVAREKINAEGILVADNIDKLLENGGLKEYDIVISFMVLEHLVDPFYYLQQIKNVLTDDGIFVCSTPNADDVMLSYYQIDEFADFTYWSEHVYLYSEKTLCSLLQKAGFNSVRCEQVQRYPLSNHLYWLRKGLPGGHRKWLEFNDRELNEQYVRLLKDMKKCDTICAIAK